VGDVGAAPGVGRGEEEQGSSWLARCCLAAVLIAVFVVVVVPVLIWVAGILIAGGR
jgi:hypothetical protein